MVLTLFSERNRMADVIAANHELIFTLPRFGIALGFGESTVEQVCKQHNVDARLFLMICNIYTFEDYLPDVSLLEKETLRGIIPYLTASHQYYLQERIPHIEHHLQRIVHLSESSQGRILLTFFEDYKNEVCSHFAYEENVVFPYISHLTSREKQDSYHFEDSHETHGDIEDKLNDLTLLILKYFPSNITTNDPYSVVLDVFRLSADLNRHALIEDKLLAPYVRHLEREEERG